MGRKTKLNQGIIQQAAQYVANGVPQKVVAELIGVSEATWYRWLQKGSQSKSRNIYRELFETIKKAEAEAVGRNVLLIAQAASAGTWQAAAWWLERRYPELFGKRQSVNLENAKIEIKVEGV